MTLSDRRLKRWYSEYNEQYFGGKLPDDVEILFAPMAGACAATWEDEAGDHLILINPMYAISGTLTRWHLLHEMAHISVNPYPGHGPKFQNEMLRLAKAGAFEKIW